MSDTKMNITASELQKLKEQQAIDRYIKYPNPYSKDDVIEQLQRELHQLRQVKESRVRHNLSITDIERLSAAGVKMDMDTVGITREQPKVSGYEYASGLQAPNLLAMLVGRLQQNIRARVNENMLPEGIDLGMNMAVFAGQNAIYTMYARWGNKPAVFEDDPKMFPSDTLLANIFLYDQHHEQKDMPCPQQDANQSAPQAGVPQGGVHGFLGRKRP